MRRMIGKWPGEPVLDLTGAGYLSSISPDYSAYSEPIDIRFGDDGNYLFLSDNSRDEIYRFSLTEAYEVSDIADPAAHDQALDVSSYTSQLRSFDFSADGTMLFASGLTDASNNIDYKFLQFTLATAWDLSTASYDGSVAAPPAYKYVALSPGGDRIYATNGDRGLAVLSLPTANDVLSYTGTVSTNSTLLPAGSKGNGLVVSADEGTILIAIDDPFGSTSFGDERVDQFSVGTAGDPNTLTLTNSLAIDAQVKRPLGMLTKPSYTRLWLVDIATRDIFEYEI